MAKQAGGVKKVLKGAVGSIVLLVATKGKYGGGKA